MTTVGRAGRCGSPSTAEVCDVSPPPGNSPPYTEQISSATQGVRAVEEVCLRGASREPGRLSTRQQIRRGACNRRADLAPWRIRPLPDPATLADTSEMRLS